MRNRSVNLSEILADIVIVFKSFVSFSARKLSAFFAAIKSLNGKIVSALSRKDAVSHRVPPALTEDSKASSTRSNLHRRTKHWSIKKKILVSFVGIFSIAIISAALYFLPAILNPMGQFDSIGKQISGDQSVMNGHNEDQSSDAAIPPEATLDEYGQFIAQGDFSILEDTVNILLIGVDYAPERDTWNGKHDYHSDVMIVLSINKGNGQVSLISLPRDTYANIPGVEGIYKLNASLNCGGEWPSEEACEQVCKAASWMIGGLPVEYYYAVDMSAVKNLVDKAVGSVEFDVPTAFTLAGRSYPAGRQTMSGQAVLDYLRVRKAEDFEDSSGMTGDLNRINRQKDMLVALFDKLKASGFIFKLPDILGAFSGNLVTNVSLAQTTALAAYAMNINGDDIKLYSMDGNYENGLFGWTFVITDQDKRVQIIKDVYGIDITNEQLALQQYGITVPSYAQYDAGSARSLWMRMQVQVTGNKAHKVLKQVKAALDADALLPLAPLPVPTDTPVPTDIPTVTDTPAAPTDTPLPTDTPTAPTDTPLPTDTPASTDTPAPTDSAVPTDTLTAPSGVSSVSSSESYRVMSADRSVSLSAINNALSFNISLDENYRKYPADGEVWALYNKAENEYNQIVSWEKRHSGAGSFKNVISQLQSDVEKLGAIFGIKVSGWGVNYEKAPFNQSIVRNEIAVDFR
jgi:LCP family protein required for cell wall assembly